MAGVSENQLLAIVRDLASAAAENVVRDLGCPGVTDVDLMFTRVVTDGKNDGVYLFLGRAGATAGGGGGAKVRAYGYCVIVATDDGTERKLYFIDGQRAERIWDDPEVGVDFAKRMMQEA
ncbi:MAG: hypothetical protein ACPGOU_06820, partial [Candidatus Nanopelagicales bacterium]